MSLIESASRSHLTRSERELGSAIGSVLTRDGAVSTSAFDRVIAAVDASHYLLTPRAVVTPRHASEVADLFAYATAGGEPLTFRSGGTSLSGQASTAGILVDTRKHFRSISIENDGLVAGVGPGATVRQVNSRLLRHGRKLGPDPASEIACTIGGVVANNSSGMACGTEQNTYRTHFPRHRPPLPAHPRGAQQSLLDHYRGDHSMRRAIVTGGMSGLGAACASRLTADGVEVVTFDVSPDADVTVDVTDAAAVEAAVAEIGQVDILINSAGIVGPNKPMWEIELQEWQKTFDVNVHGLFTITKAVIPGMIDRGWGRIVSMASMAGKDGNPNLSNYSATKAAVIGLTKSLGKELAKTGVIVNAIAPAVIETPMNVTTSPEVLAHITSLIPMGRVGRAEEVAALVSWLASDEVSFSTGAVYDISGGRATY